MAQAASGPPDFKNYSEEKWTEGVHNVVNKDMWDAAIKAPALVVVDFFATWCGPCKAIAPQIVNFSKAYPNTRFIKVDVDDLPDIAQELGIKAMPTFHFYKNGEKIQEIVGANPKAIEQVLAANA